MRWSFSDQARDRGFVTMPANALEKSNAKLKYHDSLPLNYRRMTLARHFVRDGINCQRESVTWTLLIEMDFDMTITANKRMRERGTKKTNRGE
jgi:hypothetical protein